MQWFVILLLVTVVGVFLSPLFAYRGCRGGRMTETISNAKQVFYLLIEFDQDYGQFPGDETVVDDLKGYQGEYSNDYLAQLIESGLTKSEEIFYAKGGSGVLRRPDNVITQKSEQLKEGECGFAYLKGLGTCSHPDTPVLMAAMYGDGVKFNSEVYEGRSVVLHVDGRVNQYRLNDQGGAMVDGERGLFERGVGSPWEEKTFDAKNLCYAKGTYDFTPRASSKIKAGFVAMVLMGLLLLFLLVRAVIYSANSRRRQVNDIFEKNE